MRFKPRPFTEPVGFRCLYCLDCCRGRHVYLTLKDIERIAETGKDPQDFVTFSIEGEKFASCSVCGNGTWAVSSTTRRPENARFIKLGH
jgi:Fe-S-cluster containining protein